MSPAKKIGRAACAVGAILMILAILAEAADYVVIRVRHRPAAELVDAVKAILSPGGTVIPDVANNTLVVMDETSALKKAEALVAVLDLPTRHVRLRVQFFEATNGHEFDLSVRWRYRDGGFAIGNYTNRQGGEGFDALALPEGTVSTDASVTTQDLLVMSGESGRFVTGTNVPVGEEVLVWLGRHGAVADRVVYREVSTGFVFSPTILDSEVHLAIMPFVSYFVQGDEKAVVSYDAATTVSIRDGQTIIVGENDTDQGRFVADILSGFSESAAKGSFYISVTPSIE